MMTTEQGHLNILTGPEMLHSAFNACSVREHCKALEAERDALKAEAEQARKACEEVRSTLRAELAALRAQASPDADWVLVPKKITREIAIVLEGAADDWEPGLTTIRMWQFEWDRVLAAAAPTAAARQKEGYFHVGTGGEDEPPPIAL